MTSPDRSRICLALIREHLSPIEMYVGRTVEIGSGHVSLTSAKFDGCRREWVVSFVSATGRYRDDVGAVWSQRYSEKRRAEKFMRSVVKAAAGRVAA